MRSETKTKIFVLAGPRTLVAPTNIPQLTLPVYPGIYVRETH